MTSLHKVRTVLALTLAALVLSACTITFTPGETTVRGRLGINLELADVITLFEPGRGEGSTYYVGENIRFRVRTVQDGYITLTAIDPDGTVYPLQRNIFVEAGVTTSIPAANARYSFSLVPPRGFHRVRASFTPRPTDTSVVVYRGTRGETVWSQSIYTEIESYPSDARDVRETNFYLR